jgi:hypothetical protein
MPYSLEGTMSNEKKQEKQAPDLKDKQLDADKAEQVKGGAMKKSPLTDKV